MITLLHAIQAIPTCTVYPISGMPLVGADHTLPDDLRRFYELCGGVELFSESPFPITVVPPKGLVLANPVILTGVSDEDLAATKADRSWSWYIVGQGENSQYITIDLNPVRLGQCYDSLWDRHPGNSPLIARSFTELLTRLIECQGEYYYWTEPDFEPLENIGAN
jgi:antitoxin YokJ